MIEKLVLYRPVLCPWDDQMRVKFEAKEGFGVSLLVGGVVEVRRQDCDVRLLVKDFFYVVDVLDKDTVNVLLGRIPDLMDEGLPPPMEPAVEVDIPPPPPTARETPSSKPAKPTVKVPRKKKE